MSIGSFTFNGFDIVVLLILLVSLIIAMQRGLFREILSLVSLFIAGIVSLFVWGQFRFKAQELISPSQFADVTLGTGTFILAYITTSFILTKMFGKNKSSTLGFLNRVLGAAFGVFRGLILASLLVMFFTSKYRASQDSQEFQQYIAENQADLPPDFVENLPNSMKEQLQSEPVELPGMFQDSTFYPLLNSIGDVIRNLPFAKWQSYADRIKDGDIDGISQEILQ